MKPALAIVLALGAAACSHAAKAAPPPVTPPETATVAPAETPPPPAETPPPPAEAPPPPEPEGPGPWQTVAVVAHKAIKLNTRGGDQAYLSPDKKKKLVWAASEPSEGDFPQAPVYLLVGKKVTLLGAFRSVDKVTWSPDSKFVTFEGAELVDYGKDDVNEITYQVGNPSLMKRRLRQQADEPTG